MTTEFFIPMTLPTKTHQQKKVSCRNGKPVFYEDDELVAVRQKFIGHLGKHVPSEKYTGGVRLTTRWCFPIKSDHQDGEYRITKPDTDNLVKLVKDVMTTLGYWTDDCLVASELIEKFWSSVPGLYVKIEKLL